MTTPRSAFAAVAHVLSGVDADDDEQIEAFFRHEFTAYPDAVRAIISDFIISSVEAPSDSDLQELKRIVSGPPNSLPELSAPEWDERYGAPLTYTPARHEPARSNTSKAAAPG